MYFQDTETFKEILDGIPREYLGNYKIYELKSKIFHQEAEQNKGYAQYKYEFVYNSVVQSELLSKKISNSIPLIF